MHAADASMDAADASLGAASSASAGSMATLTVALAVTPPIGKASAAKQPAAHRRTESAAALIIACRRCGLLIVTPPCTPRSGRRASGTVSTQASSRLESLTTKPSSPLTCHGFRRIDRCSGGLRR